MTIRPSNDYSISVPIKVISKNALFKGIDEDTLKYEIQKSNMIVRSYDKDSTIFFEGDDCTHLGIVVEGSIELQNTYPSGKIAKMTRLGEGNTFGEAILFTSKSAYPVTGIAIKPSKIAYLEKRDVISLLERNPKSLENYLMILSNRLVMMSGKIRTLSMGTIREKICDFLLEEHKKQKKLDIDLGMTKKDMAEFMAVQRPSLSREFIKMEQEGLVQLYKNTVRIIDIQKIEDILIG